ncbi:MAG: LUD domain-containing protein [Bacteroidales bacterium]|nr:LUD domain-containing protein [Bacteroidales bacterium]
MSITFDTYLDLAKKGINNKEHRVYAEGISERYQKILENADSRFKFPELLKRRAMFCKYKAINELEKYLIEFDFLFTRRGGRIIWASDHEEAKKEIIKLLREKGIQKATKTDSKTANELQLKETLQNAKIDCLKTETRVGITGVNFLVSDIGGLVICENEGNIAVNTSFPDIHIAICGIEKMIPSLADLDKFLHLFAAHTSNEMLPWNTQIITGPRQENEVDGPKELYLVLINNKRTEVMKQVKQREIFHCIDCGACTSVCPVYKFIGGEPYGGAYVGPVGSVVNPFMMDFSHVAHQSYACTLCKRCTEVCPMNIPIHELILQNRKESVRRGFYVTLDKSKIKQLRKMMIKRTAMDSWLANQMLKMNYKKLFGNQKIFPDLSQRSFNVRYREQNTIK